MTEEKYEELMAMPATDLVDYVMSLESRLRDAQDILHDCGYCRECFWDYTSIQNVAAHLFEKAYSKGEVPEWPSDCTPLCKTCTLDFKDWFTEAYE